MGNYYYAVVPERNEYLDPRKLADGLKLLEFGCSRAGTMFALGLLISEPNVFEGADKPIPEIFGSWAGNKIVIGSSYARTDKYFGALPEDYVTQFRSGMPDEFKHCKPTFTNYVDDRLEDISDRVIFAMREFDPHHPLALIDTSKRGASNSGL